MSPHVQAAYELSDDDRLAQDSPATTRLPEARLERTLLTPYSVFVHWERWAIVAMVGLAGIFSPLTANIYFPAIPTIADAFHESIENINLTVTVYMIVQGLAPSVWGSVADRKGRRPSFILCLIILMLSCIGLALVPTSAYWLLMVLRCVQAAGSASTIALSAGVIADLISIEERGGFIGISNIGPMIGPCIGPVIGGILADALGWRSIFWFLAIATGACMLFMILLFPETLRSQVGNGSIPAPKWNRALLPIIGRSTLEINHERPPPRPLPNPLLLFTSPDLMLLLVSNAIVYSAYYAVTATISSLFSQNFPSLSETEIGLCFLSIGGGGAFATVSTGKLLDRQYMNVKRKFDAANNSDPEKTHNDTNSSDGDSSAGHDQFPIEKACLQTQYIWILIFSASCIGYGWCIQSKTNIAGPLVMQFILGFSVVSTMTNVQTLIVDLFPTQGSSVTAANNLVRCLLGATVVSIINIITDAIGPGWTYTLCGGACVLTWPMVVLEMKMGPIWRKRRTDRNRQAQD
ncbi:MFS general substrate transporter [Phellopilus nigrolimitatus]|nr:MFS general substrate transporter [Phellopilus nigrolimitatus]